MSDPDREWVRNLVVGPFVGTDLGLVLASRVVQITPLKAPDDERGHTLLNVDTGTSRGYEVRVKAPINVVTAAVITGRENERGPRV